MKIKKPAKPSCSDDALTFLASFTPLKAPNTVVMIIGEITDQSILAKSEYLNPMAIALLMAITTREVALACRMEKPSAKIKAGTMAKPPPTPKNPVKNPTPVALRAMARMLGLLVMYSRVLLNLEIMVNATTSVRMAKLLRSRESGILLAR